jgi:hypothetical protein
MKKVITIPDNLEETQSVIVRTIARLVKAKAHKGTFFKDKEIQRSLDILQGKR